MDNAGGLNGREYPPIMKHNPVTRIAAVSKSLVYRLFDRTRKGYPAFRLLQSSCSNLPSESFSSALIFFSQVWSNEEGPRKGELHVYMSDVPVKVHYTALDNSSPQ